MWSFFLAALLLPASALSVEKLGVKFEDTKTIDGTALSLNGVCLRKVSKFGIPIKVYLGGLYVQKKSSNEDEILKQTSPKFLRMVFLRGVDSDTLEDAWTDALKKNCVGDCDSAKVGLKEFNKLMSDVHDKDKLEITIYPEDLQVEMGGRTPKSGKVHNAAFAANFLRIFIGKEPPTEDCKAEFLGTKNIP